VAGVEYWPLAQAAKTQLPPEHQMSERTISQLATDKKLPTLKQAEALSRILHRPVHALFPELS
jgi:DNA-binding XRE family transcriptional regulator